MRRTTALAKCLLISLLALLMIPGWSNSVSAGFNVWTSNGPEGGIINALAVDPQTPDIIYAGTGGGVFKSTDGGASWSAFNNGLTNTIVQVLAVDPQTPATLYSGTWVGGVFKTTDGGVSWSAINHGLTNTVVQALALDPQTPAIIYAGTWGGGVFFLK